MNANAPGTLFKLSETEEIVRQPDEDIRGRDVRDRDGEELGTVKDLLVDGAENRVRFMEVASGGFLGIGKDTTLIPVDAITSITEDEVRIDQTRERVAGAPAYDPELVRRQEDYGGFLEYYGFMPFWGGGYVYPGYPYYR